MSSWHSYSSIYNLGHAALADLLTEPVYVEEKVDGSQFSFGVIDGVLRVRSKGCEMNVDAPEKMFSLAVETAKRLAPFLSPGCTYRCEYLRTPGHNALIYDRVPLGNLILFDVEMGECEFMSYAAKKAEAERLGLDVVPLLALGLIPSIEYFRGLLDSTSVLGGQKIEGVVVKPVGYGLFGKDKKVLMGKFVSEAFKEVHSKAWKEGNPTAGDIVAVIGDAYCTQARWQKALQHLTEQGIIVGAPRDIGALMKEVPEDVRRECEAEIKEKLFAFAWPHISRRVGHGLPMWYKDLLLKRQFDSEDKTNAKANVTKEAGDPSAEGVHPPLAQGGTADQQETGDAFHA